MRLLPLKRQAQRAEFRENQQPGLRSTQIYKSVDISRLSTQVARYHNKRSASGDAVRLELLYVYHFKNLDGVSSVAFFQELSYQIVPVT